MAHGDTIMDEGLHVIFLLERARSRLEQYCLVAHLYTKSVLMGAPTMKAGRGAIGSRFSESFLWFFLLLLRFWCW